MVRQVELNTDNQNRVWIEYDGSEFVFRMLFSDDDVEASLFAAVDAEELKNTIRMLENED